MERYAATSDHEPVYPYSVQLEAGDKVRITEKEEGGWMWCISKDELGAWVPKKYLRRRGNEGICLSSYSSAELSTKAGEILSCNEELSGWLWCVNQKEEKGWVPKDKMQRLQE